MSQPHSLQVQTVAGPPNKQLIPSALITVASPASPTGSRTQVQISLRLAAPRPIHACRLRVDFHHQVHLSGARSGATLPVHCCSKVKYTRETGICQAAVRNLSLKRFQRRQPFGMIPIDRICGCSIKDKLIPLQRVLVNERLICATVLHDSYQKA